MSNVGWNTYLNDFRIKYLYLYPVLYTFKKFLLQDWL